VPAIIDLHSHTTASDGADTPTELMAHAHRAGINVLGLTDHDTTSGWDEASAALGGTQMTLIRGIELSAQVIDDIPGAIPRSVHLLGYLPDPEHPRLWEETVRIRRHRDDRLRLMVDKLSVDFDITWDEVSAHIPPGATPGRPHIAHILIEKGYFVDTTAAFAGPLRGDGEYHVPHYAPRLTTAISVISEAGGVPILAHPYTGERSGAVNHDVALEQILRGYEVFVDAGLAGLEINHRENTEEGKRVLTQVALEFDLIVTGSSDFHGTKKPNHLGENTTAEDQLERILERASGSLPLS
jgi:predicted metal-dependent phosphoesterase TrpH